ncbi:hypothetical protein BOX30_05230 [Leptospirillum ferriphilum]|nr:hypothetical protein BOX30_05230 [Leptospirillum ferriphilum]
MQKDVVFFPERTTIRMILVGIHPFLVHLLIAGCILYLLARGPRRTRMAFSEILPSLSAFLTILIPLVLLAGLLARHRVLGKIPSEAPAIRLHLWVGFLMALVWWPILRKSAQQGKAFGPSLSPVAGAILAIVLVVAAALGGWLVYGPHAIPFPLR